MAPRTARAKKAVEVKVSENEAPKKGRGKAKNIEENEQEVPEVILDDKPAAIEKKTKRGKKAQENGDTQTNGNGEEVAPPAKRGRKKKEKEPEESTPEDKSSNGDNSPEEQTPADEDEQNGDHTENNQPEDEPAPAKGRKKAAKKEEKPKATRGRKAKETSPDDAEEEEKLAEEQPKAKGRGRKAKAEVPEPDEEDKTESTEEAKAEPSVKGRRKATGKAAKEKVPEPQDDQEETDKQESLEEKTEEPKKETKGRKGKKAQAKEEESQEKEPASKKRKVTKKEEKGQGDNPDEEMTEQEAQEVPEAKSAKGRRGKKAEAAPAPAQDDEEAQDESSKKRKPTEEKARAKDSTKKAPAKNKTSTDYEEIDFSNDSKSPQGKHWNFKIASWNVDGIRAWSNKGGLEYLRHERPDILCVQETKCSKQKLPRELADVPGYHLYWADSQQEGYAGVALYSTRLAISVTYGLGAPDLDREGRLITAEFEPFYLVCVYVPNAGRKLVTLPKRLQWNQHFRRYIADLDKKKPVIICGDMNVAHNEIDLANPQSNKKNAGFTPEERQGMSELLSDGLVDTFRALHPDTRAYTFWTYMAGARAKNVGWRLDYMLVSERLMEAVCDSVVRARVLGSDHCPVALLLHLSSADKPKE